jgi:hypothetical protein
MRDAVRLKNPGTVFSDDGRSLYRGIPLWLCLERTRLNDSSFTFSGNDVPDDPYQGWLFGKFKKIIF